MEVAKTVTERRKMRMKDFLYDTGEGLPMKSSLRKQQLETEQKEKRKEQAKARRKRTRKQKNQKGAAGDALSAEVIDLQKDSGGNEDGNDRTHRNQEKNKGFASSAATPLAPTVTLDEDGKIIVNTSSLVYTPSVARPNMAGYTERGEDNARTTVCSFRKQRPRRRWTDADTKLFYRALRSCGLDFSMMTSFFPKRSRMELKRKFKREEKEHADLVKIALDIRCALPMEPHNRTANQGGQIMDVQQPENQSVSAKQKGKQKEKDGGADAQPPKKRRATNVASTPPRSGARSKARTHPETAAGTNSNPKSKEQTKPLISGRKPRPKPRPKAKQKPCAVSKPKPLSTPKQKPQMKMKPKPRPKSAQKHASTAKSSTQSHVSSKVVPHTTRSRSGSRSVSLVDRQQQPTKTRLSTGKVDEGKAREVPKDKRRRRSRGKSVDNEVEENAALSDDEHDEEEEEASGDSSGEEVSKLAQILTRGKSRSTQHDFDGSDDD